MNWKPRNIVLFLLAVAVYGGIYTYFVRKITPSAGLGHALSLLGASTIFIVTLPFTTSPEKRLFKNKNILKSLTLYAGILLVAGLAIIGSYREFPWLNNGDWFLYIPFVYFGLLLLIAEIIIKRYKVIK